jgi:hypothetical protein
MSSGIDNSGTGGASGKKFRPKKNKYGNRQETTISQSSSRILPIHAEQTSIAILTSTQSKVVEVSSTIILITSAIRRTSGDSLSNGQDTNYNCIHIFRVALEDEVSKTSFHSYYSYKIPLDSFNAVIRLESEININHSELHAYSSLLILLFL